MRRVLLVSLVAFAASAVLAGSAFAARSPLVNPFSATKLLALDSDGDGLADTWETQGVDTDGDGEPDLDLPRMGASPTHKDLFVEVDYMPGHHLDNRAIQVVVNSFLKAPVDNPDGKVGVRLHVDNGRASVMNPVTGARWGSKSQSNVVPHKKVLGRFVGGFQYDWTAYDQIKNRNLSVSRRAAFRYALSIHQYGALQNTSSGLARGIPASNFIVSLGAFCQVALECSGSLADQAGTFMHEFGHTLGLHHGGEDDINYKPNYLSIMSYLFQLGGLPVRVRGFPRVDYSRVTDGGIPDLDESSIIESQGIQVPAQLARIYSTTQWCPSDPRPKLIRFNSAVDWNCDGIVSQQPQSISVNNDDFFDVLHPVDDWSRLVYRGPAGFGLGFATPKRTKHDEASIAQLRRASSPVTNDDRAPTVSGRVQPTQGPRPRLAVAAHDDKALDRLIVSVAGKQKVVLAKSGQKNLSYAASVPAGAVITAAALDAGGNTSKVLRLKAPK
jgi:hypothetical protein